MFFVAKMREAFAVQKLLTFFQQKILAYFRYKRLKLTNDVVSFEQPTPELYIINLKLDPLKLISVEGFIHQEVNFFVLAFNDRQNLFKFDVCFCDVSIHINM